MKNLAVGDDTESEFAKLRSGLAADFRRELQAAKLEIIEGSACVSNRKLFLLIA
jgi:hypothetical protein